MTLSIGQIPLNRIRSYATRAITVSTRVKELLADLSIQSMSDETVGAAAAASVAVDRLVRELESEIERAKIGGLSR